MNIKNLRPTPHPSRKIFKRHGIPLCIVAKAVGKSYGHTSNLLSGNIPATPEIDAKLRKLAASLEDEAA